MTFKQPKIGVYGPNTRALQKRLSYEKVSLTWKTCNVYRYLGIRQSDSQPSINDIQDVVLMENRDRAYDTTPVELNVWYEDFPENEMDYSQFGILAMQGNKHVFKFHTMSFEGGEGEGLGRYMVEGDVLEIPFLTQDGTKSYWEVTDVDRKQEFEKFYVVVTATPITDRQETSEIPDIDSVDNVMQDIRRQQNDNWDEEVPHGGVSGDANVEDDQSNDEYDPRSGGDFLDDPDKSVF